MPYRGSSLERLQAVIAAQRDVIACGLELQRVMDLVAAHARTLTDASAAVVELREEDHMVYRAAAGSAEASLGLRLNVFKSLSGLCVLESRTLICRDSEEDPRVDRAAARRVNARSMVCVPLLHAQRSIGALKVYSAEPDHFREDDISILDQMVGFITAATAFAVAQNEREASDRRFRAVAELASDAIISADASGAIMFCNHSATRLFGHGQEQLMGRAVTQLLPDLPIAVADWIAGSLDGTPALELTAYREDGSAFPVEVSTSKWAVQERADAQSTYYTFIVRDVTAMRAEADRLKRANLLLDATISNIPDGVAVLDDQRKVLFTNAEFARLIGVTQAELRGIDPERFGQVVAQRCEEPESYLRRSLAPMESDRRSGQMVLREPVRRVIHHTTKRVGDSRDGGFIVIWRDVTADIDLLAQHKRASMTDPLTGVANRRAAELALETELGRHTLMTTPLSVALFDIDHFKRVNDLHGHATGDSVIKTVARVLAAQARGSDLIARWGGEEFIAILPTSREGALVFCERVCEAIRKLTWPQLERVTISAGVAECTERGTAAELVHTADRKLYEAKAAGRDRVMS